LLIFLKAHILNRSRFEPAEYWDSYGASTAVSWLFKGALLDRIYNDGAWVFLAGRVPVFTVTVLSGVALIAGSAFYSTMMARSRRLDDATRALLVLLGALGAAFLLFTGRSTFGPRLLRLVPFSVNLPFHRFFVHFHMFAILIAGWMLHQVCLGLIWLASRRPSLRWLGYVLAAAFIMGLVVTPMAIHLKQRTSGHQTDLEVQNKDVEEWWGNATYTLMKRVADVVHDRPGRAYAGGGWNWGKQFTLKFAKVYSLWQQRGLWVPNISYMWHAMGLNSEMDNHFDESRPDHLKLYNVRYVLCKVGACLHIVFFCLFLCFSPALPRSPPTRWATSAADTPCSSGRRRRDTTRSCSCWAVCRRTRCPRTPSGCGASSLSCRATCTRWASTIAPP
jgi:hypothetical protein